MLSSDVQVAKEIIYTYIKERRHVSFAEIDRLLKEKNLEDNMPEGEAIELYNAKYPSVITWISRNRVLMRAMMELEKEKRILPSVTSVIVYMVDGLLLDMPVVDRENLGEAMDSKSGKKFWLPVVFNIVEN